MKSAILPALFAALSLAARAAIVVPGADGSDGVLNITVNTVIDLSQAPTGTWDQNNAANAGKGVYDPAKWAVVFKYSSVNVATGATVTFKNHASRAPVVWLVNGNVTIAGTVSLNGKGFAPAPLLAEGGPGGFRGGNAGYGNGVGNSVGFGPGAPTAFAAGGSYGTISSGHPASSTSAVYGNPSLIPLIGGSGGSANGDQSAGGGGGAMLIACTGLFNCSGTLSADGGPGHGYWEASGGGSGGGIRVVSESTSGQGTVKAMGVTRAGAGRIRLERVNNASSFVVTPDPSIVPLSGGATALLWPPPGAPEVRVVSVGGAISPEDPRASFGSEGADFALPQASVTQVVVETKNVEQASIVKVRVTPRTNTTATVLSATLDTIVSTDPLVIRWVATLPVNAGYSAVQAHVVRP